MARLETTRSAIREGALLDSVLDPGAGRRAATPLIGALPGEGVGPEVVDACRWVLRALEDAGGQGVEVEVGGAIGLVAARTVGTALPDDVVRFCAGVFERGGAILNGPGGGRYVYDLRRRFDLFLKLTPIQASCAFPEASPLRAEVIDGIDLLVVRENLGGVYQGEAADSVGEDGGRVVRHSFEYGEAQVTRFLRAAARLAATRRGELTVVVKDAGVQALSELWLDCAEAAADEHGIRCNAVDVDLLAYQLIQRPRDFDVVAAPNLFGDVLGDLAALLVGSRGTAYGASYSPDGNAVYQTNHGAAHDIAGSDRANPVGQLLSLAMLLRESLGLPREADALEHGIREAWRSGARTADLGGSAGTREVAALVADAAARDLGAARR